MNVDGLTRENVASHLQKFRLQQKKDARAEAAGEQLAASPVQSPLPQQQQPQQQPQRHASGGTGTGTGESAGAHSAEEPDQAAAQGGSFSGPVSALSSAFCNAVGACKAGASACCRSWSSPMLPSLRPAHARGQACICGGVLRGFSGCLRWQDKAAGLVGDNMQQSREPRGSGGDMHTKAEDARAMDGREA
jgi:hypothetical protein